MSNRSEEYTVSIRLMCYNQEKLIAKAMNGIMMQKTDFKVEVVVGDDFSTDNTLKIIRKIKNTETIHIKILERIVGDSYWEKRRELGRLYNFTNILDNCTGKYIALLDGDDYWTDPLKLQKQVDFLEENGDYVLCAHSVKYFYEENNSYGKDVHRSGDYTIKELTNNVPYQPLSVLFRNKINLPFPNWFGEMSMNGDWAFFLFLLQFGKSYKMDEIMGVYRIHSGGIWSGQPDNKNYLLLDSLNILKNKFSAEVNSLLNITFLKYLIIIYTNLIKTNKYLEAREFYEKHKINIPSDYIPVFEVATSVLISQEKKLLQTNRLINDILGSNAYKLGRKSGIILNFIFPFREFKEKLFRKSIK